MGCQPKNVFSRNMVEDLAILLPVSYRMQQTNSPGLVVILDDLLIRDICFFLEDNCQTKTLVSCNLVVGMILVCRYFHQPHKPWERILGQQSSQALTVAVVCFRRRCCKNVRSLFHVSVIPTGSLRLSTEFSELFEFRPHSRFESYLIHQV